MSPGNLSVASSMFLQQSHVFCWAFCSSGVFRIFTDSVFHMLILLSSFIFDFCCTSVHFLLHCVLDGSSLIKHQLYFQALLSCQNSIVLQCVLQCYVMHCSSLECSFRSFNGNVLTSLVFLFDSGHRLGLYLF